MSNESLLCATPPSALEADGGAGDVHLLLSRDDLVYIDTGLDYTYYVQALTTIYLFPSFRPSFSPSLFLPSFLTYFLTY